MPALACGTLASVSVSVSCWTFTFGITCVVRTVASCETGRESHSAAPARASRAQTVKERANWHRERCRREQYKAPIAPGGWKQRGPLRGRGPLLQPVEQSALVELSVGEESECHAGEHDEQREQEQKTASFTESSDKRAHAVAEPSEHAGLTTHTCCVLEAACTRVCRCVPTTKAGVPPRTQPASGTSGGALPHLREAVQ